MNYTELKKSYDTVRREQLNADKELTRISKELKDLQQQYDSIDSTYEKSEASFRNKELELFRNKVIQPYKEKDLKLQKRLEKLKETYSKKKGEITYDKLLSQYSSKQEILADVREESKIVRNCLEKAVGEKFYNKLVNSLASQEIQFTESNLDTLIKYFNESEDVLAGMDNEGSRLITALENFENSLSDSDSNEDFDKIRIGSSVAIACALLLAGNITLPIIAIGLSTYAAFTVFRNYKIYRILIVQKAVQENIDNIDELLKKQVEDEVNKQLQELDDKFIPEIAKTENALESNNQEMQNVLSKADSEFVFDDSVIKLRKNAEIDKLDKQKSALMVQQSQQKELVDKKTERVKELGKQLNDMLNDLQNQYFKGVGTSKIFDSTFLFDIDPVRNKPIFFKHPQTSCLFLYSNPEDVPNFIRLLSLELRVKLNPFSLVITVIDMKNMGQDYVYFTSDDSEDLPGGTKSVFSIVALEEDLKNSMNKLSTDLLRRQSNIRREFTTIKVYNERMIELKSLTESYHFMFVIDPETNYLTNSDVTKALRVGGDLGVFQHLFINKEEFKGLGDTAVSILDAIGRVYYLEDGKLFERAKDFVVENLLSDNS